MPLYLTNVLQVGRNMELDSQLVNRKWEYSGKNHYQTKKDANPVFSGHESSLAKVLSCHNFCCVS